MYINYPFAIWNTLRGDALKSEDVTHASMDSRDLELFFLSGRYCTAYAEPSTSAEHRGARARALETNWNVVHRCGVAVHMQVAASLCGPVQCAVVVVWSPWSSEGRCVRDVSDTGAGAGAGAGPACMCLQMHHDDLIR